MDPVFVVHPDPENDDLDIVWGVCRSCGTMEPIPNTGPHLGDDHNDAQEDRWERSHACKESPNFFALSEYGDVNAYYGLDLDAL